MTMHMMSVLAITTGLVLLLAAALHDVAARTVPNRPRHRDRRSRPPRTSPRWRPALRHPRRPRRLPRRSPVLAPRLDGRWRRETPGRRSTARATRPRALPDRCDHPRRRPARRPIPHRPSTLETPARSPARRPAVASHPRRTLAPPTRWPDALRPSPSPAASTSSLLKESSHDPSFRPARIDRLRSRGLRHHRVDGHAPRRHRHRRHHAHQQAARPGRGKDDAPRRPPEKRRHRRQGHRRGQAPGRLHPR